MYRESDQRTELTPQAYKNDENNRCRRRSLDQAQYSNDNTAYPRESSGIAGNFPAANPVREQHHEDQRGDVYTRSNAFDGERISKTCLLEKVCSKGREERKADKLLRQVWPEGDDGAEAVGAAEYGIPMRVLLLQRDFLLMLDCTGDDVELAIHIIIFDSTI